VRLESWSALAEINGYMIDLGKADKGCTSRRTRWLNLRAVSCLTIYRGLIDKGKE